MIFTFGNDAAFGHWYCIVLDKREHVQPPTVTLYDSGYFSPGDVRERCSFFVKFLNALNRYGRSVYSFQWSHNQFDEHDFSFIGGRSVRQQNGFDCGIYALLNGECALQGRDNLIYEQNCIPYIRLNMIKNLREFFLLSGENVQLD